MTAQSWDPEGYARHARFVSELGQPVLEWLAPHAGERVLDLGCGDGALTVELLAAGCEVVGVDSSPEQVAAARTAGIDARVCDARHLDFDREFDAVFSNAVLHWIKPPGSVISGVVRALVPGGRFVGEFGGKGNVTAIHAALADALARRGIDARAIDPWYFPSPEEYTRELEAHGFTVERIELFPRPTPLPTGMSGWLETFAGAFAAALPPAECARFFREVEDAVRDVLFRDGQWFADYVRLRFAARKRT
ncbi:MAG: methyltransferase domain-containing protein [Planctomycetes bacterium]|nr:methyltransferase domain-containing protein [Planctomycetota bacterium]